MKLVQKSLLFSAVALILMASLLFAFSSLVYKDHFRSFEAEHLNLLMSKVVNELVRSKSLDASGNGLDNLLSFGISHSHNETSWVNRIKNSPFDGVMSVDGHWISVVQETALVLNETNVSQHLISQKSTQDSFIAVLDPTQLAFFQRFRGEVELWTATIVPIADIIDLAHQHQVLIQLNPTQATGSSLTQVTDLSDVDAYHTVTKHGQQYSQLVLQNASGDQYFALELRMAEGYTSSALEQFNQYILVISCVLVLAFFATFITNIGAVIRPIQLLRDSVLSIKAQSGKGLGLQRVDVRTQDEIGELAMSINDMLEQLFSAKNFSRVTLNSIGDAVITVDSQGNVTYLNESAASMLAVDKEALLGQSLLQYLPFANEDDKSVFESAIAQIESCSDLNSLNRASFELKVNKETIFVEQQMTRLHDAAKGEEGTVMVLRDISQHEKLKRKLSYQACYDSVTKLYNRHKFEECLKDALSTAKMEGRQHLLCQIDMDRFKLINDNAGHTAGDQLLLEVATLFKTHVRKTDICARVGGDEFSIILYDTNLDNGMQVVGKINDAIKNYQFIWGGQLFNVAASIGVSEILSTSKSIVDVHKEADAACYAAKAVGQNSVRIFDPNNEHLTSHQEASKWAARINDALINDRFVLYCQSIFPMDPNADTKEKVEILLRLNENGELLMPGTFLPAAERFRLINKIDRWVVKHVFHWLSLRKELCSNLFVSINLSGDSLTDEDLYDYIVDLHKEYNFPADTVCFEVTESAAVTNLNFAKELIFRLREYGFTFALDDFGKGFSSYSYLQNLPADYVKIDGSFVRQMHENERDRAIVQSIHQISQVMGMQTIAEFVETESTIDSLKEIGVDYAQGFGLGRPMPLNDKQFLPIADVVEIAS